MNAENSPPLRIGLVVINPLRDLPSQVLLAMRLCQDGCTVLLISGYLMYPEIWTLSPDFVLLEDLRRGKNGVAIAMARAGIRVGVLEAEGGVFPDPNAHLAVMSRKGAALQCVSGYYSWGPRIARHIVADGRLTGDRVVVTGTPRMDFYAEPWRRAALDLSPLPEAVRRPFVLLNGTFNMVNPLGASQADVLREYVGNGHDREMAAGWMESQRGAREQFVSLSRRLAARLPNVDFVYRPHPFEDVKTYGQNLAGYPNLRLIQQGAVQGWILRAAAVVHCGSSTAVDAALAGIPAFAPSWIRSHLRLPVVEALSLECDSEEDLGDRIRSAISGNWTMPPSLREAKEEIVADWFFTIDGRCHDRVAAAIRRACGSGGAVSLDRCRRALDGVDGPTPPFRRRLRYRARRIFHLPLNWSFRNWRDVPCTGQFENSPYRFGVEDVRSIAATLEGPARSVYGSSWRRVKVQSASKRGEYHFGYRHGRSIALTAE